MDSPSSKRVAAVHRARKGRRLMAERINEEGWRLLNVANESLQFDVRTTSSGGHAVLSRRDFSSSADVFPPFYHANLSLLCWKVSYKRILMHSLTTRGEEG